MKKMKKSILIGLIALTAAATTFAGGNVQTISARAEIVLPGYTPEKAVEAVHDGFSWMLNPARKSVRFLPNPIPARPDDSRLIQVYIGGVGVPDLDCPAAYAEFTFMPKATGNVLGASGEIYRGCLYAFEKGFKLDVLVTTYRASDTGIGASVIGGIGKLVQGNDEENLARWTNRLMGKLRDNAPDMLVALLEIPGSVRQQPDIEAVNALMPPRVPAAQPAAGGQPAVQPASAPLSTNQGLSPRMESQLMRLPPEQRELARQQMLWMQQQMRMQSN